MYYQKYTACSLNMSRTSSTNTCKNPDLMSKMQPFLCNYAKTVISIPALLTLRRIDTSPLQKEISVIERYHFSVNRFFCCSFVSRYFAKDCLMSLGNTWSGTSCSKKLQGQTVIFQKTGKLHITAIYSL